MAQLIDFSQFRMFGFETKVLSEQTFNVVCVTKRNGQKNIADFHFPIAGEAKVKTMIETAPNGVSFARTVVSFNGMDCDFSYVRNGLNGMATVIGVHNCNEPRYTEWELYTDTPSAKPDREGQVVTAEMIREDADFMIKARGW